MCTREAMLIHSDSDPPSCTCRLVIPGEQNLNWNLNGKSSSFINVLSYSNKGSPIALQNLKRMPPLRCLQARFYLFLLLNNIYYSIIYFLLVKPYEKHRG